MAERQSGLTRRQVVTAGAWSAPVVLLATAIPAAAASPDAQIAFTDAEGWYEYDAQGKIAIRGHFGVQAAYLAPNIDITGITVVLTIDALGLTGAGEIVGSPGWAIGPAPISNGKYVYTVTYGPTLSTTAVGSTSLDFRLFGNADLAAAPAKEWVVVLTASNARGDSRQGPPVADSPPPGAA